MKGITARRVARGAEFMDRIRPGWFNEIDLLFFVGESRIRVWIQDIV